MKKYFYFIFGALLLLACKNNGEQNEDSFLKDPVGVNKNGRYEITNLDNIRTGWESIIVKKDNEAVSLEGFEIIKTITEGDAAQECFILLARTSDGYTKTAALLTLNGDKFYFAPTPGSDPAIFLSVNCSGVCDEGCDPMVTIKNGYKSLICSSCVDCAKIDTALR